MLFCLTILAFDKDNCFLLPLVSSFCST
jgi:hypothetical protein